MLDGLCFTEEERNNSSLAEEKEEKEAKEEEEEEAEKEETGDGGQAQKVETPDLIRSMKEEGEGEPGVTSSEVESGSPGKKTIRRRRLSKKQSSVLKGVFKSKEYLTPEESKNLASNLKLSREQVKSWFTQRRYNQKGTQSDGLHHCAVCQKTHKSRSGSLAHQQKHLMDLPTPTQPFFAFDPNLNYNF